MASSADVSDSLAVPGLSGAEVDSFIELLKKILNNPTPRLESHPNMKDEGPIDTTHRAPILDVDLKSNAKP